MQHRTKKIAAVTAATAAAAAAERPQCRQNLGKLLALAAVALCAAAAAPRRSHAKMQHQQLQPGALMAFDADDEQMVARSSAPLRPLAQLRPPPPPNAAGVAQLARSPASALLAAEFFARERDQLASAHVAAAAAAAAQSAPPMGASSVADTTASGEPEYSAALDGALRLDQYHPLDEIYAYIDALPARYDNVHVFTLTNTAEGRPIKALELVNNASDADFVWLDALTHAREWVTGSTMLYIIDQLVAGAPLPGDGLLRSKNYIVVPVVNPDGYVYTWTTNRMWRKNRARTRTATKCIGADLNRNFDHTFGGEGSSRDPCSHIYAGSYPFSEQETKALGDLLWSLRDRVKFYLTLHSYNQLWSCPYAHTTSASASIAEHMRVLRAIQRAVQAAEGVRYDIGPLGASLYVGSGFGIDFAYDKCHIEHSYLVELRDKGTHGFLLPADQIMPTARETFAGLRAGINAALGNGGSGGGARATAASTALTSNRIVGNKRSSSSALALTAI